ncbi:MAG: 4-phosphoerythronate dehydrogenase [Candidatus Kapabacteria bacterium]|nr:4-phosphoerythronate dehydrogenase [Candidatus Kapabacteria bacterium]
MIIIDDNIPFLGEILSRHSSILVLPFRNITQQLLVETGATALCIRSTLQVNKYLLHGTSVRFVGTATSGTDHVDSEYLRKSNIQFADAHGSNAQSVAEYVLYSVLRYQLQSSVPLQDTVVGIVGIGAVGSRVAILLKNLGMKVLVCDPPRVANGDSLDMYGVPSTLLQILDSAHIITNHVPLVESGRYPTVNLFSRDVLPLWKRPRLFIHTSRGGITDEEMLIQLHMTHGTMLAIDTWCGEPTAINSEYLQRAAIASPHIAGHSANAKLTGSLMIARAYAAFAGCSLDTSMITDVLNDNPPIDSISGNTPRTYSEMHTLVDKIESHRAISAVTRRFSNDYPQSDRAFTSIRRDYVNHWECIADPSAACE